MAVLEPTPRRFLVLALLLGVVGCMLTTQKAPRFAFSHAEHVGEQELECVNCHADAGRLEAPGMPSPDTCAVCHDELDVEKSAERRVAGLFTGESFRAAHALDLDPELRFSHARHVAALKDCALCHDDVVRSRGERPAAFAMDRCTTCHAERNAPNDCATCHTRLDTTVAPPSHLRDWKRAHGRCVRSGSEATADRCELCHQESSCIECHQVEPPANHTAHWLARGHGLTARTERQDCAACHREDSCASCHAETPPRSHTAAFGAPQSRHCYSCHFPLAESGCGTCHRTSTSHALAAPKPADPVHVSGQDCRQCHGLSAPLPHADNGNDCNACHH